MDNYLDSKGKRTNALDIVAIVVFGLFVASGITVLKDDITGNKGASTIGMSAFLLALFVWGVAAAVNRIIKRRLARKIAEFLFTYPDADIKPEVISRELGISEPSKTLLNMQRKHYLQNVNYDPKAVVFHTYYKQPVPHTDMMHVIKCPNCSAECRIYADRINRCEFCGSELIIGDNVDIDM